MIPVVGFHGNDVEIVITPDGVIVCNADRPFSRREENDSAESDGFETEVAVLSKIACTHISDRGN